MKLFFHRRWVEFQWGMMTLKTVPFEFMLATIAFINGIIWILPGNSFNNSAVLMRLAAFGTEERWAYRSFLICAALLIGIILKRPGLRIFSNIASTFYFSIIAIIYLSQTAISIGTWYNVMFAAISLGVVVRVFFNLSTEMKMLNREYHSPIHWRGFSGEKES